MIEKMKCKNNEKAQPIMNVHAHKSKPENLEAKKNADNISIAINETDEIISSVFLSDYFLNEYLPKFASEQWDKMKVQDRRVLMATVNTLVSETLGNEAILKHGIIKMNMPYRDENLLFKDGECWIYDKLFTYKGIGISLLINYIRELRKYICYTLAETSFYDDVDYYSLRGKAKIYYENLSESILYNSWSNYLQKDNPDYRFQPLVLDSEIFSMKLLKEFLKDRFNKTQDIDKEISTLSNEYLEFVSQLPLLKENSKRVILNNRNNMLNSKNEELLYAKYLENLAKDPTSLSDQEFYELLNSSYYNALCSDDDGELVTRLSNLSNELIRRTFKDFDLKDIELPVYSFYIKDECLFVVRSFGDEVNEAEVHDVRLVLNSIGSDLSRVAQVHDLFKFANEKEKDDYFTMRKWINYKNHKYDSFDDEIISNELNIILKKSHDLIYEFEDKVSKAINNSQFYPHGTSMITFYNKQAQDDFFEFRNGRSNQETYDLLMELIRLDLKESKNKGVR